MGKSQTGLGIRPPHPGEVLNQDILPKTEMTVGALSAHLGVTRGTISTLLNEKRDVSHDMAIRLGKACGNGTRFWLALQMQFDLWNMERERTFQIEVEPLTLHEVAA